MNLSVTRVLWALVVVCLLCGDAFGQPAETNVPPPRVTAAVGFPFGVAVWLGAHVVAVPALGLGNPPTRRPIRQEAEEFGLHTVYGVTTELVRRRLLLIRLA